MMCIEDNCNQPSHARQRCKKHYRRYIRAGGLTKKLQLHGMYYTKEYNAWRSMKLRCSPNNKTSHSKQYREKGIKVCERWINDFLAFYEDLGPMPTDRRYSLERKDNNGNYEPSNCYWATYDIQAYNRGLQKRNTSGYRGVAKAKTGWQVHIMKEGISYSIGQYQDIEMAALAYDTAAIQLYGDYAQLNILDIKA